MKEKSPIDRDVQVACLGIEVSEFAGQCLQRAVVDGERSRSSSGPTVVVTRQEKLRGQEKRVRQIPFGRWADAYADQV